MIVEFPIRENDTERIINDFKSIRFPCIRCGLKGTEIIGVEVHVDKVKIQGLRHSNNSDREIKMILYVTGLLFCKRCNHRFHMKILDQGTRNTNVYFDNMLS